MDDIGTIVSLKARYPGRAALLQTLEALWTSHPPSFIHLVDPTTTQNTSQILSSLISLLPGAHRTVKLSALELVTPKVLFDHTLNGLANFTPTWQDGLNWSSTLAAYSDNWDAFVHALQTLYQTQGLDGNCIIVIENAERLREFVPTCITPLARLADLTNLPICVTFLSHLPWDEIRPSIGSSVSPYTIQLESLTPEELLQSLSQTFLFLQNPTSINPFHPILSTLFHPYTSYTHQLLLPLSHSPQTLAYILATHWATYITPVLNDWTAWNERGEEYELPSGGVGRLNAFWRGRINGSLVPLVERSIGAEEFVSQLPQEDLDLRLSELPARPPALLSASKDEESRKYKAFGGLSSMARYLLIASYLASYNPTKMDARLLAQTRDPTKKYRKSGPKKARPGSALKIGSALSGPSTFSYDRLWALTGALLEIFARDEDKPPWASGEARNRWSETEVSRTHVQGLIQDLVARGLLSRTTAMEKLETQAMYRCNISMEFADRLCGSLSVGMKLGPMLWEEG